MRSLFLFLFWLQKAQLSYIQWEAADILDSFKFDQSTLECSEAVYEFVIAPDEEEYRASLEAINGKQSLKYGSSPIESSMDDIEQPSMEDSIVHSSNNYKEEVEIESEHESASSDESYGPSNRKARKSQKKKQPTTKKSPSKQVIKTNSSSKHQANKLNSIKPSKSARSELRKKLLETYNQNRLEHGLGLAIRIKWSVAQVQGWLKEVMCKSSDGWSVADMKILEACLDQIYFMFERDDSTKLLAENRLRLNESAYNDLFNFAARLDLLANDTEKISWKKLRDKFPNFSVYTIDYKYWNEEDHASVSSLIRHKKK